MAKEYTVTVQLKIAVSAKIKASKSRARGWWDNLRDLLQLVWLGRLWC